VLKHEADAARLRRRLADVAAVQPDAAGVHGGQARDHAQDRALAAAAGADQHKELAVGDFQRHLVDHRVTLVAFGELLQLDRHGARRRVTPSGQACDKSVISGQAGNAAAGLAGRMAGADWRRLAGQACPLGQISVASAGVGAEGILAGGDDRRRDMAVMGQRT